MIELPVNKLLNIHSHREASTSEFTIMNHCYGEDFRSDIGSVGFHPLQFQQTPKPSLQLSAFDDPRVLMIGECGIDYRYEVDVKTQTLIFEEQLDIAKQLRKPVVIHQVKAYADLLRLRKQRPSSLKMVIHGFRGKKILADQLIQAGFYLSFGAHLLETDQLQQTFGELPIDRLFLETDESEAPLVKIYQTAADLSGKSLDELRLQLWQNFKDLYP
ncbi:TatD family hydrolase (plasmid) [Persicobacter psychrovividus]|uniref:TatD family hydrolase n=2 Tax=Persicobacter psychrovividus TaxID=387638 RepID=A0ABN6LFD8_9BACT|nr:TatD family hydrolase [Persicobacter psychrovividus]